LLTGGRLAHTAVWRESTVKWVKRILLGLVVVFALFYLFTRPEDAADAVQGAVDAVFVGAEAVGRFFTSLAA
jgi:hypothetical protein